MQDSSGYRESTGFRGRKVQTITGGVMHALVDGRFEDDVISIHWMLYSGLQVLVLDDGRFGDFLFSLHGILSARVTGEDEFKILAHSFIILFNGYT